MNTLKKGAWVRRLGALGAALALAIPAGFPAAAEGSVQNSAAARPDDYAAYLAEQAVRSSRSRRFSCPPPTFTPLRWSERGMSPMSPTAPANRRYALRTGARSPFRRRRGGRAFIVWRFLTGRWTGLSARWNAPCGLGGGLPFAQADSLLLPKQYEKTVAAKDNRGNDIRPSSVVRQDWTTHTVADSTGMYGALLFPLSAGENRLTLTFSTARWR